MGRIGHWPCSFRKAVSKGRGNHFVQHNIDGQRLRVDIDQTPSLLIGTDVDWHTLARTLPVGGATVLTIAPSEPHRLGRHPRQEARATLRRRSGVLRGCAVPTAPAGARRECFAQGAFLATAPVRPSQLAAAWPGSGRPSREYRRPVARQPSLVAERTTLVQRHQPHEGEAPGHQHACDYRDPGKGMQS